MQSGLLVNRRGRNGGTWVADEIPPPIGGTINFDWRAVLDLRVAVEVGPRCSHVSERAVRRSMLWSL